MKSKTLNVRFITIDAATGFVAMRQSLPERLVPTAPPEGQRIVIPADRRLPAGQVKLNLRKVRKPVNHVASIDDVLSSWRPPEIPAVHRLEFARQKAIAEHDRRHAARIEQMRGPLASIHAEKRRQAEAGGGPLVADEADRLAILANAEKQDEQIALIEKRRRAIKEQLRAAATEEEIEGIMKSFSGFSK